jgi:hypothetical protein
MAQMRWSDISHTRPGFRIYQSGPYLVQKKDGFGLWRLFHKEGDQALRTIFSAEKLSDCKLHAETYEESPVPLKPGEAETA